MATPRALPLVMDVEAENTQIQAEKWFVPSVLRVRMHRMEVRAARVAHQTLAIRGVQEAQADLDALPQIHVHVTLVIMDRTEVRACSNLLAVSGSIIGRATTTQHIASLGMQAVQRSRPIARR